MPKKIRGTVATQLAENHYFAGYANAEERGYSDSSKALKNFKKSIKQNHKIKNIKHNGPHRDRSTAITKNL